MKIKFILFAMMLSMVSYGQENPKVIQDTTTVGEINKNPSKYHNERVVIEGIVTEFVPENSESNAQYQLKGKFGGLIIVNTDLAEPEQNTRVRVFGTVYYGGKKLKPFIDEKERVLLGTVSEPPWLIIVFIVTLVIILIWVLVSRKSKNQKKLKESIVEDRPFVTEPSFSGNDNEFKTIKINLNHAPRTMRFIPGKLDIVGGADAGKSFRIAGYPTPNGSIVSIGRAEVKGDRAFSHIKLEQSTISRQQAELREFNKKLYIKNLTNVNKTQVDGVELEVGEEVELYPGQTIRMGELELMYTIK